MQKVLDKPQSSLATITPASPAPRGQYIPAGDGAQLVQVRRVIRAAPITSFWGRVTECYRSSNLYPQPPAMLDLLA